MSTIGRPPTVRELVAQIRDAGGQEVHVRGSHQKWRLPNGRHITVVVNHMNDRASRGVWHNVLAALSAAGAK